MREANACKDHIMLVSIPPKLSISKFIGYLKGKKQLNDFGRHANFKYKYTITVLVSKLFCWFSEPK